MDRDTVYNDDPGAQALVWAQTGFGWIHVVDLNGAFDGQPVNTQAVQSILEATDLPVQLGGGIRSIAQIEHWLSGGISRVILGTVAVRDPVLVKEACSLFPGQIAVGIDARAGMVAVEGWAETSDMEATALAAEFADCGVSAIIYTDIDRDGTGQGVNIDSTRAVASATNVPVIASGGVHDAKDITAVREAGLAGVIIGRALYEGSLTPQDALEAAGC